VIFLCFRPVSPAGEIYTSNEQSKYPITLYYLLSVGNNKFRILLYAYVVWVSIFNHKYSYISVILLPGLLWLYNNKHNVLY